MNVGFIVTLCVILAVALVVCVAVCVAVRRVRQFSREVFATDSLAEGLKNQREQLADTPRSVPGMTRIYLPLIQKDFPEFNLEQYRQKAQMLIKDYLIAISEKSPLLNPDAGEELVNQTENIVADLKNTGKTQHFSEIVIHQTEVTAYKDTGATKEISLQSAVGLMSYITDADGRITAGDRDYRTQTVYQTTLVYVQDRDKIEQENYAEGSVGINCPNCGAPVKNTGVKFCEYCGTGIKEVNIYSWKFNRIDEITKTKKNY